MLLQIHAVYDRATGAYMQPFFVRSRGEAIRTFMDAVKDAQSPFARHPEDFSLFVLGTWDDGTAEIKCGEPERLITALECRSE